MTNVVDSEQVAVPLDVIAYAEKQGILSYLRPVIEFALGVFPDRALSVALQADPEIENDWRIVIRVDFAGCTVEERSAGRQRYRDGIFNVCPPSNYAGNFVLSLQ